MSKTTPQLEGRRANYALDFTWDVRNHVPPHTDPNFGDDREAVQHIYNRINMMTFLLEDIPFEVFLDAPVVNWIDHAIYKVANQGRWPGRVAPTSNPSPPYTRRSPRPDHPTYPDFPNDAGDPQNSQLRGAIHDTLGKIKAAAEGNANGHPPVKMRYLWDTNVKAPNNDPRVPLIYNHLKTDWFDKSIGFRFCLPFIDLQEAITATDPPPVPKNAMDVFIETMKGVTHRDVFSRSVKFFPRIKTGVDHGKAYGIFDGPGSGPHLNEYSPKGGGGPNNRICDAGLSTCITHEGSHCTTDLNGLCTSG